MSRKARVQDKDYQRRYHQRLAAQARVKREAEQQARIAKWEAIGFKVCPPCELEIVNGDHEPKNVVIVEVGNRWGIVDYYRGRLWLTGLHVGAEQKYEPSWSQLLASIGRG